MAVDIMDMVEFRKLDKDFFSKKIPFKISFPYLKCGWLNVNIRVGDDSLEYQAAISNLSELADVIAAVADLLPTVGDYDKYFHFLRTRSRIRFDLEPQLYIFDFRTVYDFRGYYAIQLLIAKQYMNYDSIWYDQEDFEEFSGSINGFDNFKKSILLAIELPLRFFAERFYFAMEDLSFKTGKDRFEATSEYPLVDKQLKRIRKYLDQKY